MTAQELSTIGLWTLSILNLALNLLLLRQFGIVYLGTAEGVSRDGLKLGAEAPRFATIADDGTEVTFQPTSNAWQLLVFGSASCSVCRSLIPHLNHFVRQSNGVKVTYLSQSSLGDTREFKESTRPEVPVFSVPSSVGDQYQVRVTPFAFLIDPEGRIRSKGILNTGDHIMSMLRRAGLPMPEQSKESGQAPKAQEGLEYAGH